MNYVQIRLEGRKGIFLFPTDNDYPPDHIFDETFHSLQLTSYNEHDILMPLYSYERLELTKEWRLVRN